MGIFQPDTFADGPSGNTPITAAKLNNLEAEAAENDLSNPESDASVSQSVTIASALIVRDGFFNARSDTAGGVAAALAATDHTAFLQSALATAQAAGYTKIYIPQLDPANPNRPWVISDQLDTYPNLTIDAKSAIFKMVTLGKALFYTGPTTDYVTIHLGYAFFDNGLGRRPLYSEIPTSPDVNGHTPRMNSGAIVSDASYCNYTADRISGFVFGVILSTDGTVYADRYGNRVNILVDQVDFGLAYGAQNDGDFTVRGSYIQMTDSTDPAHLVYGTGQLTSQNNNRVNVNAWDSPNGGVPVSMKAQSGTVVESLIVRNCPGLVNVVDPLGPITFGNIHGTNILTATYNGFPTSAIEWGFTGLVQNAFGSKTIGVARISFDPSVSTTSLRALNMDDDWTVGQLEVTYQTNVTDGTQTMVQANGNRSRINSLKIRNLGTGGIRGLRYVAGTSGHHLASSPTIIGGADGVTIDPGVLTSTFVVDEQTVKPIAGYAALVATPDTSNTIRTGAAMARRLRTNRWYAAPVGATSPVSPALNNLCIIPVVFQRPVSIDKLGLVVTTAVAASTIRLGIYAEAGVSVGFGYPGALIVDAGTVDTSTTGLKTAAFTKITLPPGAYYLAYVLQGATGVAVQGFPLTAIDFPAAAQGSLTNGIMPTTAGVSGVLPAPWVFASDSVPAGVAKISYEVPN